MLTFPPDISFVIQIASFLVLWFGLKRLLFDPVLRVLDEREARTLGTRQAADELTSAAHGARAEYDRRIHEVRLALSGEMDAARVDTQRLERRVTSEAREQASAQLMQLRDSLGRQAEAARTALATDARDLAGRIFERVVGRTSA